MTAEIRDVFIDDCQSFVLSCLILNKNNCNNNGYRLMAIFFFFFEFSSSELIQVVKIFSLILFVQLIVY